MAEPTDETVTAIEIHPGARYMLLINRRLTDAEMDHLHRQLSEWWKSSEPVIVAADIGIKLVRVDE